MWLKAKTVPHRKLFLPGTAEYARLSSSPDFRDSVISSFQPVNFDFFHPIFDLGQRK